MCDSFREKKKREVKMQEFSVCTYNSQDFAQTQENVAQSHNHETVTFRNYVGILSVYDTNLHRH